MNLRDDSRGRIPFAVLGALLLITSTIYASSAAPAPVSHPVTDQVIDQAQVEARMALSTAVRNAGRRAAANPVIDPAPSGFGTLLSETQPFRSYLRLLIAIEARKTLAGTEASRDDVLASVSLPPLADREDVSEAMSSIRLRQVEDDRYRVTFEGLDVEIRRHGRRVETVSYNTSLTTPIPALEVHDRTNHFQERLQAGLAHPGFTQDLTTRLFAVTWARGYAQYGGAPIENVLANRHVAVMANDALLAQQSAVFGRADRDGLRKTRRAATDVAARDGLRGAEQGLQSALKSTEDPDEESASGPEPSVSLPSAFDAEQSFAVDATADETFLAFVDGDANPGLESVLDRAYRATVRAEFRSRLRDSREFETGTVPENVTFHWPDTRTNRRLSEGEWTDSGGGSTLRTFSGTVVVERVRTDYWVTNNSLETTTATHRRTYEVSGRIMCEGSGAGPSSSPRSGCGFGATALERLRAGAMEQLVRERGGSEDLAIASVSGGRETRSARIDIEPPEPVADRSYDRVASLRQTVKEVSVSTETRSIASSANPASLLADTLSENRGRLVGQVDGGDSVAERAIVAAEAAYLDQLESDLRSKSSLVDRAQRSLAGQLRDHAIPMTPPKQPSGHQSGPGWEVAAEPAYLSIAPRESRPPPMATRNVNLFTVPYGDAADTVTAAVDVGGGTVSLGTAARTLRALEGEPGVDPEREQRLRRAIEDSLDTASEVYRSRLRSSVGPNRAGRAVRRGFRRFDSAQERALAIAEGRMAGEIADSLPGDLTARERDRLQVELRATSRNLRERSGIRIDESLVSRAASEIEPSQPTSDSLEAVGEAASSKAWERATGRTPASMPAGLPLVPVPGYWYATANAWTVSVRGSYDRFTVRAPSGSPGRSHDGTIEYVRTDEPVELDVIGDDRPERLGHNRAISFTADTGVLIVVPPGGTGVGDVDGNADERSPGWGRGT